MGLLDQFRQEIVLEQQLNAYRFYKESLESDNLDTTSVDSSIRNIESMIYNLVNSNLAA